MTDPEEIPEGWTRHDGGPCPVDPNKKVRVMFREGRRRHHRTAGFWSGGSEDWWKWENEDHDRDIIAYRVGDS